MSLAELERFQTKALAHYTGMWMTWLTVVKPHYRGLEAFPTSPQWQMKSCHGAVAPKWACWNLEARLWTKQLLLKTRDKIEVVRVDAALRNGQLGSLTTDELYAAADREVQHGGIYGIGWGAASPLLKSLCYEALNRAFGANAGWARFVVNRESGCNPSAQNVTYAACSDWSTCQRATGLSQMIPAIHRWVDYTRAMHDLRYSVYVFFRLSNGGRSTGPWG
jgi:hypothetical protein